MLWPVDTDMAFGDVPGEVGDRVVGIGRSWWLYGPGVANVVDSAAPLLLGAIPPKIFTHRAMYGLTGPIGLVAKLAAAGLVAVWVGWVAGLAAVLVVV